MVSDNLILARPMNSRRSSPAISTRRLTPMKVFLSSTYEDLREHRVKAAQAIERLGQHGVRMEVFGARPGDATGVCRAEIEASDAFLGIYAHRCGYVAAAAYVAIAE